MADVMHFSNETNETLRQLCAVMSPCRHDYCTLCDAVPVINQNHVACPFANCRTQPKGKADFLEHLNTAHLKFPSHPCDHCDRVFYGNKAYRRHLRGERVDPPSAPFFFLFFFSLSFSGFPVLTRFFFFLLSFSDIHLTDATRANSNPDTRHPHQVANARRQAAAPRRRAKTVVVDPQDRYQETPVEAEDSEEDKEETMQVMAPPSQDAEVAEDEDLPQVEEVHPQTPQTPHNDADVRYVETHITSNLEEELASDDETQRAFTPHKAELFQNYDDVYSEFECPGVTMYDPLPMPMEMLHVTDPALFFQC